MRVTLVVCSVAIFLIFGNSCGKGRSADAESDPPPIPNETFFRNPVINGSDPWVVQKGDQYYYTHTLGTRIALWKTDQLTNLDKKTPATVFTPTNGAGNSKNVWAPEIHYLNSKWYIYFTAGSGPDNTQRLWVLENTDEDPTTTNWQEKGRIFSPSADFWAIDGTVMDYGGMLYFLWSGRPVPEIQNQHIFISRMSDPWTLEGDAVKLSSPEFLWEINGPVNEAPQILKNKDGDVFMIYSASGCWTDEYALGMLTLQKGGDPMNLAHWTKSTQPVFKKAPANRAFGPGHNAFFKSPDGKEDWIIYHANTNSGEGCGEKRNIRMQPFTWNNNGVPVFSEPVGPDATLPVPSGL